MREVPRLQIRTLLVASDLTERTDAALGTAFALAGRVGADVHGLHALDLGTVPFSAMGAADGLRLRREAARDALEEQLQRVAPEGAPLKSRMIRVETVPKALLERAAEIGADLIVIGPAVPRRFRGPIWATRRTT
jgi:nucleotide-binding universal stress UspA family protein